MRKKHHWPADWPERMQAGDETVLCEILKSHGRGLLALVDSYFPDLGMFSEDMVQTALVRVWKNIKQFKLNDEKRSFRAWVLTILRNTCLDFLRGGLHRSRQIERSSTESPETETRLSTRRNALESPEDEVDPVDEFRVKQVLDLTDILNSLPAIKRRIILSWVANRDYGSWAVDLHKILLADDPPIVIQPGTLRVKRDRIWKAVIKELRLRGHEVPDEPIPEGHDAPHKAAQDLVDLSRDDLIP